MTNVIVTACTCLLPLTAQAATSNDYCVTPAFISASVRPNLLLMIDNSASMYDLVYQDTANTYCANATTTACTAGTTCAGAAICRASGVTTTETTYTAKPCTSNANCTAGGSKCESGYCSKCNTNNGVGDCISSVETIFTPTVCTNDGNCSATPGDTCNNKCDVKRQCYDTTYSSATTYTGYFDEAATYSFDFTNSKFISGAAMPGSCTYSTGTPTIVCVNTTGTGTAETVVANATGFVAKGNFLNWLTTSKFDVEKQILTGGKFDPVDQLLVGESRGCAGRKFIKQIPGMNLTFSIRGGTAGGISSTQSQATEYGQTYIDISTGTYNASECLAAMNDWMNVSSPNPPQLGAFQNDTKGCVGSAGTIGGVTAVSVWNHILHDCYQGMTGGAQGYSTNLGPLLDQCQSIYASIPPADMTDPSAGYAVCSSVLTYAGGTGYLGACWNGSNFTTNCTEAQRIQKMADYCNINVNTSPVADPSSTAISTFGVSAPGFILEQGLLNTQPVGTFPVKVAKATAPTGLINKYSDRIRFGTMTFQNNGAGTECGGTSTIPCIKTCSVTTTRICYFTSDCPITGGVQETCGALGKADGGKIVSYVGTGTCSSSPGTPCSIDADCASLTPSGQYCNPSIGSHSAGLVKSIDDIPATSWTPFAESFYNAIGYFARINSYTANPPTSRSDAGFNYLESPNTVASYDSNLNPSQFKCQSNNIMLVTDGMSTADQNSSSEALATLYASQAPYTIGGTLIKPGDAGFDPAKNHGYDSASKCPPYAGSRSISTLAWAAKNRNIKTLTATSPASTTTPQSASEFITTYIVYSGPQTSSEPGLCDPKTLMNNAAVNSGTSLFAASSPAELYNQIDRALSVVAAKAASGTAASILSNSEGSGANMLQAVFFPLKIFENSTEAKWIGEMQNLWYYVDPFIGKSSVREDTNYSSGDHILSLKSDYTASFFFDTNENVTRVQLMEDTDGDGLGNVDKGTVSTDEVKSIWRAGKLLYARDASSRTIHTSINGSSLLSYPDETPLKGGFADGITRAGALQPYLQASDSDSLVEAKKIINYIRGADQTDYRSRKVSLLDADTPADWREWKLGDIISSTPRIQSTFRLNQYSMDTPTGYGDLSYYKFINTDNYKNRGMVYVGANDGMLHAFKMGKLTITGSSIVGDVKAILSGTNLGEEQWAYVPRNALPYLKYYTEKDSYQHLYYVDGQSIVSDVATGTCGGGDYSDCPKDFVNGTNWRTVVIGSMGLGGATRIKDTAACTDGVAGTCVKTPIFDPADATNSKGLGYSSYFTLDVTNQYYDSSGVLTNQPTLNWEFSSPDLGYSTSGVAIAKINAKTIHDGISFQDKSKNGKWFAVFASGPTGPIDVNTHRFMAKSDQNLKIFIVDLGASGTLVQGSSYWVKDTGIKYAFGGSMIPAAIDADRWNPVLDGNYSDDALYVGYTKSDTDPLTAASRWSDGGVLRILTHEDPNPDHWTVSRVIDGIGSVTTGITRLQDRKNKKLWLYFGTGRYYYSEDDANVQRYLMGVQDRCYTSNNNIDPNCDTTLAAGDNPEGSGKGLVLSMADLVNNATACNTMTGKKGWYVGLRAQNVGAQLAAERSITDAVPMGSGMVLYTTFKPTTDVCKFGGNSYMWALKYDDGCLPPCSSLGDTKVMIQMSTGSFEQADLKDIFACSPCPGCAPYLPPHLPPPDAGDPVYQAPPGPAMIGKPPTDPPSSIPAFLNPPLKKILHIRER